MTKAPMMCRAVETTWVQEYRPLTRDRIFYLALFFFVYNSSFAPVIFKISQGRPTVLTLQHEAGNTQTGSEFKCKLLRCLLWKSRAASTTNLRHDVFAQGCLRYPFIHAESFVYPFPLMTPKTMCAVSFRASCILMLTSIDLHNRSGQNLEILQRPGSNKYGLREA